MMFVNTAPVFCIGFIESADLKIFPGKRFNRINAADIFLNFCIEFRKRFADASEGGMDSFVKPVYRNREKWQNSYCHKRERNRIVKHNRQADGYQQAEANELSETV